MGQDSGQQTGKFQGEMQRFLATNAQLLSQAMSVMESVTNAVASQNGRLSQIEGQMAQLTQFASSTSQRSQKAGYR